ncbi:hypothetical protein [Yoonia sp.]|uniref:hypothetical protein n=1 Tax=Yoonia sp. TaxID=2212373 RepID=UPI0025D54352|nr:hypothetical protein [Yoonia sp.]
MSEKWCTKSTNAGYATSWRRWLDFCSRRGFDPICGPELTDKVLRHLSEFLTELSNDGLAGGTVANARSSLCGAYELLLGTKELGSHPWLTSVVKTANNRVPKKPRYEEIWDASLVVGYWARTPASTLTAKRDRAISLGFLALFARPSDLARISRLPAHWQALPDKYRFRFRCPKEARGVESALSPWIELPFLPADGLDDDTVGCCSCAGRAWKSYFDALESSGVKHLPLEVEAYPRGRFLSVPLAPFTGTPPIHGTFHHPLGAQRLSTVMKAVMTAAGVDTSVYKGGSGRHAGSSAAAAGGSDLLLVMRTARWSSFKTFRKFYLRARITDAQRRGATD